MARIILALALVALGCLPAHASTNHASRACKMVSYSEKRSMPGFPNMHITYRIFFANNGAVQMYSLVRSSHNQEADHAALLHLQKLYGLEFVNAPPLRITSYKKKTADLSVPDRAIDSCGRVTYFH